MKLRRTQYVAALGTCAVTAVPQGGLSPTGWHTEDNILKSTWFYGQTIPSSLFSNNGMSKDDEEMSESDELTKDVDDYDDKDDVVMDDQEAWSEDSEDSEVEDEE